jgi:hypothetical protein
MTQSSSCLFLLKVLPLSNIIILRTKLPIPQLLEATLRHIQTIASVPGPQGLCVSYNAKFIHSIMSSPKVLMHSSITQNPSSKSHLRLKTIWYQVWAYKIKSKLQSFKVKWPNRQKAHIGLKKGVTGLQQEQNPQDGHQILKLPVWHLVHTAGSRHQRPWGVLHTAGCSTFLRSPFPQFH